MKTKNIQKLNDKDFQGFTCDRCGADLKHAFSVDGSGSYGKECILTVAGIKGEKQVKKQMSLQEIWNKMLNNPKVYSLDIYIEEYGIEEVEQRFFKNGCLS